ncbi:MAG TPA: hypothetical protein VIN69_03405 [Candidatus Limnocylindria bacterium]
MVARPASATANDRIRNTQHLLGDLRRLRQARCSHDGTGVRYPGTVQAARGELREILRRLDERTLAESTVPGSSWTAKDVLSQGAWTHPGFDAWNERTVGPQRGRPFVALRAELETSQAAVPRELEDRPEDVGPFGPGSCDQRASEIRWLSPNEREHAEMIARL